MIYSRKRNAQLDNSSGTEKLLSIIGLILVSGFIGGIAAMIYGFVRNSWSGKVGGIIVTGSSAVLAALLLIIYLCCLKKNQVNSRTNQRQTSMNERGQREYRGNNNQSEDSTISSSVHRSTHSQQICQTGNNPHYARTNDLADSNRFGPVKSSPTSPSKAVQFSYLNQSHGSHQSQHHAIIETSRKKKINEQGY